MLLVATSEFVFLSLSTVRRQILIDGPHMHIYRHINTHTHTHTHTRTRTHISTPHTLCPHTAWHTKGSHARFSLHVTVSSLANHLTSAPGEGRGGGRGEEGGGGERRGDR